MVLTISDTVREKIALAKQEAASKPIGRSPEFPDMEITTVLVDDFVAVYTYDVMPGDRLAEHLSMSNRTMAPMTKEEILIFAEAFGLGPESSWLFFKPAGEGMLSNTILKYVEN